MVKVTRKKIKEANLRQVIRPNIGKIVNIRKSIRQPLSNNTNVSNSIKFSLYQKPEKNNFNDINLTSQTNDTSKFLLYNIQDINTPNFSSHDIQNIIQYENSSFTNNEIQENHVWKSNNYENNDQENYFQELNECKDNSDEGISFVSDECEDNSDEGISFVSDECEDNSDEDLSFVSDECEDNSDEDLSFTFKNQYDGLQNAHSYYGEVINFYINIIIFI
jgi:hypothetical protein